MDVLDIANAPNWAKKRFGLAETDFDIASFAACSVASTSEPAIFGSAQVGD